VIKIDPYNFELLQAYRSEFATFFLRHSVVWTWNANLRHCTLLITV